MLLQGTATTRKFVDDDCSREYRKTLRRWERSIVLEMSERLAVKLTDELRELVSRIPQLASSTRELEDLITDLINRLQTKTPSEAKAIERLWQVWQELNKDQDVKTNDHVSRIQGVLHSLAVKLRDDDEFVTEAQDPRYSQTHSHTTSMKERLDSKLRDRDDQTISRSDAVLRRMHRLNLLGQTETKLDYVLGRTTAKISQ